MKTIKLYETKHTPVHYLDRKDIDLSFFQRTDHATYCPYKGITSYWPLVNEDIIALNSVWSYESPLDNIIDIEELMSFYINSEVNNYEITIEEN